MAEPTASFYPNLCLVLKVKVLGYPEVHATTDQGCANHEIRHFIDRAYLHSLNPQGRVLLEDYLVTPTPPCSKLFGTRMESSVVGMLKGRLEVSLFVETNATFRGDGFVERHERGWIDLKLQNVLVVEDLPVPLHLSLKAAKLFYCGEMNSIKQVDFPSEYHGHAYWQPSNVLHLGSAASFSVEKMEELQEELVASATGKSTKVLPRCATCGKPEARILCQKCRANFYCDQTCQKRGKYCQTINKEKRLLTFPP
jgi:hypothetical protein